MASRSGPSSEAIERIGGIAHGSHDGKRPHAVALRELIPIGREADAKIMGLFKALGELQGETVRTSRAVTGAGWKWRLMVGALGRNAARSSSV